MRRRNLIATRKAHKNEILFKDQKILNFYIKFKSIIFKDIKRKNFALAVSGGADSLCLAYFSKIYSTQLKSKAHVLIVDHKLRKESTIEALREFVDNNSGHQLAGNAQYWYGETFRVRQLYQDAASAYLDGYQKYPKSSKAPVNLLKLGVMLVQIGEKDQGCSMILGVKDQYPKAKQSVIQKAEYEKKKFNCDKKS